MHHDPLPQIQQWDWRFQIGFDPVLRSEVAEAAAAMPSGPEKEIQEALISWSLRFVSLDAVIERALQGTLPDEHLLAIEPEKLLSVPPQISPGLKARVSRLVEREQVEILTRLCERAEAQRYIPLHQELFGIIFGAELEELLSIACQAEPPVIPPIDPIHGRQVENLLGGFLAETCNDPRLNNLLRQYPIPDFELSLQDGEGYAEYWSSELTGETRDRLVLYRNDASMDRDTLIATLAHEVYPGHGLFYELVKQRLPNFIDHGALALVEGWATWLEWNSFENDYSRASRRIRQRGLSTFNDTDPEEVIRKINLLRSERKALDPLLDQLIYHFQYPGFQYSYCLGAMGFARHATLQDLPALISRISDRPWGDYFRVWSQMDTTS